MKARDIMTKNIAYVSPASTIVETAQLMQKHNVGSVPVCDQNGVVGIVTDRDIVVRNVAHGKIPKDTTVSDVMTSQVTTVSSDADITEVSKIMAENQIRRVPVVDNNRLVGVISLGDLAVNDKFYEEVSEALANISFPAKPLKM